MAEKVTQVRVEEVESPAGVPITVLRYTGDITSASKAAVLDTYQGLALGTKRILLDFSGVDYLNSSGIALVIQLMIAASKSGQTRPDLRPETAFHQGVYDGRNHQVHKAASRRANRTRRIPRVNATLAHRN
jgi:hypothetical protein